jgi:epoxyqueuosine reductase
MALASCTPEYWTPELRRWLDESARDAGFDAVGVAGVPDPNDPISAEDSARFAAWIDSGHAGEMEYLKRRDESGAFVRSSPTIPMPWARSVIVCALNYNAEALLSIDPAPPGTGWIARYAWSGRAPEEEATERLVPTDYHDQMLVRLRRIEAGLHAEVPCTSRCYVDTGPILERSLAARAGVGWIGKNTCVIDQGLGSWLLLGVIVTSLPADSEGPTAAPEQPRVTLLAPDRCGTCTRCIDACPTGALLGSRGPAAPREMDASRCIAYLTIEKKGAIDEALRPMMGRQVFGCDICQDVCPWNGKDRNRNDGNRKAPISVLPDMQPRPELINPVLEWLASLDAQDFKRYFKGSPLERTGRKRLLRNVAIAMGNSGNRRFLPQLEAWSAQASDETLRETAQSARAQILSHSGPVHPVASSELPIPS